MQRNMALVIQAPMQIVLEERPVPRPGPDEVLVEVQYVALCGSDVKLYAGSYTAPHRYPVVMGHEWVGRVAETGSGVVDLQRGDAVTGDCSVYCGDCFACYANKNHCTRIEKRGITVDGGCSRYIVAKRLHLYKCPPGQDYKPYVLTEPTAVGVNGILTRVPQSALMRASRAAVLGAGGIGLLSLLSLAEYPIREIVVVDPVPEKLALAESFGLAGVFPCGDLSRLQSGFDIVVEAAGATQTLQACPSLAAPAGHIVLLGHQKPAELDFGEVIKKSLTIHASNGSTGGFEKALQIIEKRREQVSGLITATVPLAEAPAFMARQESKNNIKVVIDLTAE